MKLNMGKGETYVKLKTPYTHLKNKERIERKLPKIKMTLFPN